MVGHRKFPGVSNFLFRGDQIFCVGRSEQGGACSRPASNTTVLKFFFADRSPPALVACHRWLACMEVIPFFKSYIAPAGSVSYGEYAGIWEFPSFAEKKRKFGIPPTWRTLHRIFENLCILYINSID